MPGTDDLAPTLDVAEGPVPGQSQHVSTVAFSVLAVGVLATLLVLLVVTRLPEPEHLFTGTQLWPVIVLAVASIVAEIVYVPIPNGDEELTFYEVVLLGALLIFAPSIALVVPLFGLLCAELFLSKTPVKAAFNVGSYMISSSLLVTVYVLVAGDSEVFSAAAVIGLVLGSVAFASANLVALGTVLRASEGTDLVRFVREQWSLSAVMGIGNVAVATTAIALAIHTPLLVPFALLPAVALWYAYQSSAQHTEAVERSRWMLALSSALAQPTAPEDLVRRAGDALRRVFGADDIRVVTTRSVYSGSPLRPDPPSPADTDLVARASADPSEIPAGLLPGDWFTGYVVQLPLASGTGALALGGQRKGGLQRVLPWAKGPWQLSEVDLPVLTTVSGSFASALRANEHLAALRDETAKLSAVVDHATDGIIVLDGGDTIALWSPAMARITGLSPQAAGLGEDQAGSDVLAQLRAATRTATGPAGTTVTITRPDSEVRELDVSVVALDDEVGMRVVTVRDVTEQRRVERMKSDFIATVSHELRTPITPIKGYAQLLKRRWERMPEQKRTDVLATIEDRADHLSRLVDDLLLASRVSEAEHARLDVAVADVDLEDLVRETVRAFPDLADRIVVSGSSATVRVDRVRAIQCLSNLIGNAGKYSPPQSPIAVEFHPLDGGRWAAVDVVDHGRGIPAEELDKVFERFYRVEDPMTMTTGGSGLGLFISRELARAMSGDITVQSSVGAGSTFRLQIPLASGDE